VLPSGNHGKLSTMSDNTTLLSSFEFQVKDEYSSLFCAVLLSYWDNIMGPRVERLWHGNDKVELDKELISFVTSHTLNGELCRVTEEGQTDMKFYVLSDRGYLFSASIFLGSSKHGKTVFSLTFIMAAEDLNRYLELQQFLNNQVELLIMKLRVLQEKGLKPSVKEFSPHLKRLFIATDQLNENRLPIQFISIKETLFWNRRDFGVENVLDEKFLMRAITSHLQTGGCTLVVGSQKDLVNLVVNTLALFLTPNERACSKYANGLGDLKYERDLFLQGLVRKKIGDIMESKDVILNSLPTTYIDIDSKEILQTGELHLHYSTRAEFLRIELSQLLKGDECLIFPTRGLYHDFEDIAKVVQSFVTEIGLLPFLTTIREKCIGDFMHLLHQKSAALVSFVEAKSLRGVDTLSQSDILKMKHDLALKSEADFRIVLAQAKKTRNGIVPFLFGDHSQYGAKNQAIKTSYVEML